MNNFWRYAKNSDNWINNVFGLDSEKLFYSVHLSNDGAPRSSIVQVARTLQNQIAENCLQVQQQQLFGIEAH